MLKNYIEIRLIVNQTVKHTWVLDDPHLRDKEKSVSIQNLNLQTLKRSHPKVFCEKVSLEILQS